MSLCNVINDNCLEVNLTFRVIAKHFDSRLFGRRLSRKKKLSFLSLRLLYRVNCNPGKILILMIFMESTIRIRFGLINRSCPEKSKKVQVFDEVIQDLAKIQPNGSATRPVFVSNHSFFYTVARWQDRTAWFNLNRSNLITTIIVVL